MKKLSTMTLCAIFASMQIAVASIDTGLNNAIINKTEGGFTGIETGNNSATLNFNNHAHVNWDSLNVGKGETLNFNATDGSSGLIILNTVNSGMTKVYGAINANEGIQKLIISNPNGMLYDGASFMTTGDVELTTQALGATFTNKNINITGINQATNGDITIQNSDFSIGGNFTLTAPTIKAIKSAIKSKGDFRLVTRDGSNYLVVPPTTKNDTSHIALRLESVSIDGNVYIVTGEDIVNIVNGGTVNGDLNIDSQGNVFANYKNEGADKIELKSGDKTISVSGKNLDIKGNVNIKNDGRYSYLRNSKVGGNVSMTNSGGCVEIVDSKITGNAKLTTTAKEGSNKKNFIHVGGNTEIGGNLDANSAHNIHLGGYHAGLQDGMITSKIKVNGNINANAKEGSIGIASDVEANKISLTSGTLNIISDGKSKLTANEYSFKANGYIGGLDTEDNYIKSMEDYTLIPPATKTYLLINGGKVNKIDAGDNGYAFVEAKNSMDVTGVNVKGANLKAGKDMTILGTNKAQRIVVDGETDNLKVENDAHKRGYTLEYTNIRDGKTLVIENDKQITYEKANGENGWNINKNGRPDKTTYLVVPGNPLPPNPPAPIDPVTPVDPTAPEDHENVKVMNNLQKNPIATAIDAQQVYTPVAFAADLDDEINTGVRKNVDGSVTVVKPFTPSK